MFDEECTQLTPVHISSKPNKGYPSCHISIFFYYIIGWHFSHTSIHEKVCSEFISGPIAFKFWTNLFTSLDYLVICTFSMWHCLKSGPCFCYLFHLFLVTPCFVVAVQFWMDWIPVKEECLKKVAYISPT